MARLIGTAGHVDHGKTTLIRALTGIDADRLPEEKKRGMTIDIGFAYIDFPEIGRVSIVDVPGHEKFIHNMLVGALGIDVALLCVSADEAVMQQTREHFEILRLLPVDRMVVALTRADLADEETRQLARLDVEELLKDTRFENSPIIPVSAHTGEGLENLRGLLAESLKSSVVSRDSRQSGWYLPIDRAFAAKGHGTVVTGTLAQNEVIDGDRAVLEPGSVEVRVRAIQSHDQSLEKAEHGMRVALNLGGIKLEDVHRGMAVGSPGAVFETRIFDARMEWLVPPKHNQRVRISIGAAEAMGKAFLNEKDPEIVQFRLESPVPAALEQPVIVRRYSPMELMGGGRIVTPVSKPRRKTETVKIRKGETDEEAILEALKDRPEGVPTEEICRLLGKTPQALGTTFESLSAADQVRGFAGLWFAPAAFESATKTLLETLNSLHEYNPSVALHPRERVVSLAKLPWAGKPLDRILAALDAEKVIAVSGNQIRAAEFRVRLSDKQMALLKRVTDCLDKAGVNAPSPADVAKELPAPVQAIDEIIRLGIQAGEVVRVADGLFYTPSQLKEMRDKMAESFGGKPFAASDFRDLFQTSRKYTIPLLEYFDSNRVTLRQGDLRTLQ